MYVGMAVVNKVTNKLGFYFDSLSIVHHPTYNHSYILTVYMYASLAC